MQFSGEQSVLITSGLAFSRAKMRGCLGTVPGRSLATNSAAVVTLNSRAGERAQLSFFWGARSSNSNGEFDWRIRLACWSLLQFAADTAWLMIDPALPG
ncbi:hypothetical protein Pla52n_41200 [Stieleria varia]|uniref:Uncharacterized protein n=1 Tax=Stieleria varia TaxID=2528005 RepID=A0A5C6AMW5_9BACT|nr:hypothetical protein Pla52n_41200 [Stieleria varia]